MKGQVSIEFLMLCAAVLAFITFSVSAISLTETTAQEALQKQYAKNLSIEIERAAKKLVFFGEGSAITIEHSPKISALVSANKIKIKSGALEFWALLPEGIIAEASEGKIKIIRNSP